MKFFMALFFILTSAPSFAETPLPIKKPMTNIEKAKAFDDIIENVTTVLQTPPTSIIIPPPLPPEKISKEMSGAEITMSENGVILPSRKPLHIRNIVSAHSDKKIEIPTTPHDRVIIRYRNDSGGDDRMAGGSKKSSSITTRTYADRRHSKLKETADSSPFKAKNIPRAEKVRTEDPVIIFFQEQSSDLEVGQLDILRSDILIPMKRSKGRKAIIYGYAEKDHKDKEKAQQLSLARALLISDYLIDNRIDDTRLEIRPMASDTLISPRNRVDIVIYN